jgi:hypothetical protein
MEQTNDSRRKVSHSAAAMRAWADEKILADCRWEAFRASGPGGQKRNKTSSAIRLVHEPTGIAAIANESRSQQDNRKSALRRLRHRMTLMLREVVGPDGFSAPAWFTELCRGGRLSVPGRSENYLPAMGLVLDVLAAKDWSVSEAAAMLGLTTGTLVRFLQRDDKLLAHVNEMRSVAKLKPLGSGG